MYVALRVSVGHSPIGIFKNNVQNIEKQNADMDSLQTTSNRYVIQSEWIKYVWEVWAMVGATIDTTAEEQLELADFVLRDTMEIIVNMFDDQGMKENTDPVSTHVQLMAAMLLMASDSKLIKWFSSVIKFVDSFSIEPDAEFPQRSEYCKNTAGDLYRIDKPLHCSTPIPRTAYCSHSQIMDHKQKVVTENSAYLITTYTMPKNAGCNSREISQNIYCLDPGVVNQNQMNDETQFFLPKSASAMLRKEECCSTPIPGTAYCSHPEIMDHNQMDVTENSASLKKTYTIEENAERNSTQTSRNACCSDTGIRDHNQIDDETQIFVPKPASTMLEDTECCCTPIPRTTYCSYSKIMDHKQMAVIENSTFIKITSTKQENAACFKERNFVPSKKCLPLDCGESFRSETEGASSSRTPGFEESSEHWTNVRIGYLLNPDRWPKINEKSPKSTKKDTDLFFENFLGRIAQQVAEGLTLSEDAIYSIEILLLKVLDTIVSRAAKLASFRKRKTLMKEDLRMAIELTLPPKMAFLADRNASLKVLRKGGK
ncbi:Histone H2B type F-M like protein [Argiope bruennichi]|uniref:Histone H2B type F-M like protein n=1 Tax=Argiope bruennichi TaxID=94029 RepID=A0A8T0E0Z6_ARGBR|nr:Histone H2B type F-M like protein [Argiope bruennichi]